MLTVRSSPSLAAASVLLVAAAAPLQAAKVRYHYVPADVTGTMVLQPLGPNGAPGELISWFGSSRAPYNCAPNPTCFPTLIHPCTHRALLVPLALPASTPRMEHGASYTAYNYGSDVVEVRFLPDGSVDVIYNSGLLRAP